jgi:outer membrane protein assembly factor BamB
MRHIRWRVTIALVFVAAAAAACAPHSTTSAPATPSAPPPVSTSPTEASNLPPAQKLTPSVRVDLTAALGDNPLLGTAVAGGKVYTASSTQGILSVDPTTGQYTVLYKGPSEPDWMVASGADLWVQYQSENLLRRIHLPDGKVTAQVPVSSAMSDVIAATPGAIWTVIGSGGVLVRIDEQTAKIVSQTTFDDGGARFKAEGLEASGNSVFVAAMTGRRIVQVDATGTIKKTWPVPFSPCTAVPDAGGTFVWVFDCDEHALNKLDLASGTFTRVTGVDALIGSMIAHAGETWFTMLSPDRSTTYLVRVNAASTIDKTVDVGSPYSLGAFAGPDGLWVGAAPGLTYFSWDALTR